MTSPAPCSFAARGRPDIAAFARVRHASRLFLGRPADRLAQVTAWAGAADKVVVDALSSAEFAREIEAPLRDAGVTAALRHHGEPGADLLAWAARDLALSAETRDVLPGLLSWRSALAAIFRDAAFQRFLARAGLAELADLADVLAAGEAPLWRLRDSGSRLVAPGPAVAGIVPLPAVTGAAAPVTEDVARSRLVLVPIHELATLDRSGEFRATGGDPQFSVALPERVQRYRLRIAVDYRDVVDEGGLAAQLYLDLGEGLREEVSALFLVEGRRLEVVALLESPTAIERLRFDPANQPCTFSIGTFELQPLPGLDSDGLARERQLRRPPAEAVPTLPPPPVAIRARDPVILVHGEMPDRGRHLVQVAGGLARRGRDVTVVTTGGAALDRLPGLPGLRRVALSGEGGWPAPLEAAMGQGALVHAFGAQDEVRDVVAGLCREAGLPYLVHIRDAEQVRAGPAGFTAKAAGVTLAVAALRPFVPAGLPAQLVEPGIDFGEIGSAPDEAERQARRRDFFIPPDATVLMSCGEDHPAERRDAFSLYTAVMLLRRRGRDVVLVRSGREVAPPLDLSFDSIRRNNVISLGEIDGAEVREVLRLADLFVQPGAPAPSNRYRFPSHLPACLALGQPLILPHANLGCGLRDGVEARLLHDGGGGEIARIVAELIDDPAGAESIGRAGLAAALRFDVSETLAELDRFYDLTLRTARMPVPGRQP